MFYCDMGISRSFVAMVKRGFRLGWGFWRKETISAPLHLPVPRSSPVGFTDQYVEKGHVEWLKEKLQTFEWAQKVEANQCLMAFKKKVRRIFMSQKIDAST